MWETKIKGDDTVADKKITDVETIVDEKTVEYVYVVSGGDIKKIPTENLLVVDGILDASSKKPIQNAVVTEEINTLKKSVSDGKKLVADAVTEKGVDTATDATFEEIADNISKIKTGDDGYIIMADDPICEVSTYEITIK